MQPIGAGIVLYNPDIERLKRNINSISKQVDKVWLIDNGSDNHIDIEKIAFVFDNIILIHNLENLGIATALNQLCSNAEEEGYKWVLTLDQDTIVPANMISIMTKYLDDDIGIVCPAVNYEGSRKKIISDSEIEYPYACMTSASLTNIVAWRNVGGFRDDYFIDFVDNEFCMKLKINGYKILRVNKCIIDHQLGESRIYKLLGIITIRFFKHSDLRFYYITRNNKSFIKEYSSHLNVKKEYCKLLFIISRAILFSENRKNTVQYIRAGWLDAKKNNLGKKQF